MCTYKIYPLNVGALFGDIIKCLSAHMVYGAQSPNTYCILLLVKEQSKILMHVVAITKH